MKTNFVFVFVLQVFVYHDKERKHSKKHKLPLTAVFIGGCPANTCSIQFPEIIVPPVPATDTASSKIIHITYELKVNSNREALENMKFNLILSGRAQFCIPHIVTL